jgi:hypothetical protein
MAKWGHGDGREDNGHDNKHILPLTAMIYEAWGLGKEAGRKEGDFWQKIFFPSNVPLQRSSSSPPLLCELFG